MKSQIFGGNFVKRLNLSKPGKELLGGGSYEYFHYQTISDEVVVFDKLKSFSVFIYSKPADSVVTVKGLPSKLDQGDRVQSEGQPVELKVRGGEVCILVAGTTSSHTELEGLFLTRHADLYKVIKPWGYELWINGIHPCYALKEIFIKAGTKTSLQYHNMKKETNVLLQGIAKLHYKINAEVSNDEVNDGDIAAVLLEAICSVDVMPKTLHRIEAVTDILLFEASSPHLDDVVRVVDDTKRPDGWLDLEHGSR
jgi:mannose-6-phosphate isomerase